MAEAVPPYHMVGANIDTWILNVKTAGAFPAELGEQLDELKAASQEIESDLATGWSFEGDKLNHIVGKARLASVFLWESA